MTKSKKQRLKIPEAVAITVLVANRRTCCICRIVLHNVQIHHIDGNPANSAKKNLAVVCPNCHSAVSGKSTFGRNYSAREVLAHKQSWERQCQLTDGGEHEAATTHSIMSTLVSSGSRKQVLLASAGECDFIRSWLPRLLEEANSAGWQVQISKLIIKQIRDSLRQEMEEAGRLEPGFGERLRQNLKALRANAEIIRRGILIEERFWEGYPPFHGFVYGDTALVNKWGVDSLGRMHVQNRLIAYTQHASPEWFRFVRRQFNI